MTVADLEKRLHSYGHSFLSTRSSSMPVPEVDASLTMSSLGRDDLLYQLGAFLRGLNPESAEAIRHFQAALEINPRHARALSASGRYEESLAADPNDPELYLTYAESLLGTQIGPLAEADQGEEKDAPAFRKARELAGKALAIHGDEARARGDYGVSFLLERDKDLGPAIEALQRAHALAPWRNDFAVHLFAFLRRTGDPAEPLLAQLLALHNKQVTFAARAIVVHTELARANALSHDGRLDEAATVIRDLAGKTEDAESRRDLLRQADELARVGATNRQITLFNDAVAQVNAGKYSAARKLLTALLATATDQGVIRDAQKLVKELAGKRDLKR
jgi:tetratricopeptide (TPR) repeat protein